MRLRVAGGMRGLFARLSDTVAWVTPAFAATVAMVTGAFMRGWGKRAARRAG